MAPPLPSPPPPGGRGQEATQPGHPHPSPLAGEGPAERGQEATQPPPRGSHDAIILADAHREFIAMGSAALRALGKPKSILHDVKAALPADQVDGRL